MTSIFISEKSLRFAHRIAAAKTKGAIGSITKQKIRAARRYLIIQGRIPFGLKVGIFIVLRPLAL
ncbi:hypothetical protein PspR76_06965 [Pseudomonas sp. R76]|nr:hypothetical protein PspR76_06965 [Pseudomonas sp. R76]